jgi:hypothetical protein
MQSFFFCKKMRLRIKPEKGASGVAFVAFCWLTGRVAWLFWGAVSGSSSYLSVFPHFNDGEKVPSLNRRRCLCCMLDNYNFLLVAGTAWSPDCPVQSSKLLLALVSTVVLGYGSHVYIFYLFRPLCVLKWGLLFDDRKITTGHPSGPLHRDA